jgi:hypothetical protein
MQFRVQGEQIKNKEKKKKSKKWKNEYKEKYVWEKKKIKVNSSVL